MRRLTALALCLGACAQDVVTQDPLDATLPSDAAPIAIRDDARPTGLDATPGAELERGADAGELHPDATNADASVVTPSGCMRRIQDNVFVPDQPGMAGFSNIRALRFGPDRKLYVLSRSGAPTFTGWVTVLGPAPDHALVRSFGHAKIRSAMDLIVDAGGNVSVLDFNPNGQDLPMVHVFDPSGAFIRTWTADGGGDDEAWSMSLDDMGRIYVGGLVVARYDARGVFLDLIGTWGGSTGRIGLSRGLAPDRRGFVWVADLARNKVHQFDLTSRAQVTEIGGRGAGPGQFDGTAAMDWRWGPTHVEIDAQGAIYANDPFVSRIQKLSRQGIFLGEFSFGGSMDVGAIRVEPAGGNVYVGLGAGVAIVCPL